MPKDPIQVYENHSGPIPPHSSVVGTNYSRYHFAYVAYRDAEADYNLYGYGHTPEDAIADYCRNEAETICVECDMHNCQTSKDCILSSGELHAYVQAHLAAYHGGIKS